MSDDEKPNWIAATRALAWLALAVSLVIVAARLAWNVAGLVMEACHR